MIQAEPRLGPKTRSLERFCGNFRSGGNDPHQTPLSQAYEDLRGRRLVRVGISGTRRDRVINERTARLERILRCNRREMVWFGFLIIVTSAGAIGYSHRGLEALAISGALISSWALGTLVVFRMVFRGFLADATSHGAAASTPAESADGSQRPPPASLSLASLTERAARYDKLWPALGSIVGLVGLVFLLVEAIFGI